MPLVKYLANFDPSDGTGQIRLAPDEDGVERHIVLNGPAVDLSDQEFADLRGRYQLSEEEAEEAPEEDAPASQNPNPASSSPTPFSGFVSPAPTSLPSSPPTPDAGN